MPASLPLRISPDASSALTSIVRSGRNVIASVPRRREIAGRRPELKGSRTASAAILPGSGRRGLSNCPARETGNRRRECNHCSLSHE